MLKRGLDTDSPSVQTVGALAVPSAPRTQQNLWPVYSSVHVVSVPVTLLHCFGNVCSLLLAQVLLNLFLMCPEWGTLQPALREERFGKGY